MLWGSRFKERLKDETLTFTSSIQEDVRLYREEIELNIAWANMLERVNLLNAQDRGKIEDALKNIKKEMDEGSLFPDFSFEDIHSFIYKILKERIGDCADRLYAARSRNDQIAQAVRLYIKKEVEEFLNAIKELQKVLLELAENHKDTLMPEFTHLQPAEPTNFAQHIMAYFFMLQRDKERLKICKENADVLVLGACACTGTSFSIDQEYLLKELSLKKIAENATDAVSDRDFLIEFVFALSLLCMHLSRLCEELIIWSFESWIEFSEGFYTGSSIMPHKKNPDVAELIRGRCARAFGALFSLLSLMKAQPLSYNRDMQEDKVHLFNCTENAKECLKILTHMMRTIKVNKEKLREKLETEPLFSVEMANYLVKKGISFREAHAIIGAIIKYMEEKGKRIKELKIDEIKRFSPLFEEDLFSILLPENIVKAKVSIGSPGRIEEQIKEAKALI